MTGEGDDGSNRNKTVFRPSPLQRLKQRRKPAARNRSRGCRLGFAEPADDGFDPAATRPRFDDRPLRLECADGRQSRAARPPRDHAMAPSRLGEDDVPAARQRRGRSATSCCPRPALARSGCRHPLGPGADDACHSSIGVPPKSSQLSTAASRSTIDNETRQRAKYAAVRNDRRHRSEPSRLWRDAAEWARRSLVVGFFHENISGDRFWQLVDDMLRYPNDNRDLIELVPCLPCRGL